MFHKGSKLKGHGLMLVGLGNSLTYTCWFNCRGKGVFGHCIHTFGFEDLVHGSCCHGMGSLDRVMRLRRVREKRVRTGRQCI